MNDDYKFFLEERQMADDDADYTPSLNQHERMKAKKFAQRIRHVLDRRGHMDFKEQLKLRPYTDQFIKDEIAQLDRYKDENGMFYFGKDSLFLFLSKIYMNGVNDGYDYCLRVRDDNAGL